MIDDPEAPAPSDPAHASPLPVVGETMPAVLAHRLAFWSKDAAGLLTLVFAEERAQLARPDVRALHVCARIALPVDRLEATIAFLQTALDQSAFAATAPSTTTVN